MMGKDSRTIGGNISGWSMFFLLQLGFCAILSVMSFISDNYYYYDTIVYVYNIYGNYGIKIWRVWEIIFIVAIVIYAIIVIRSFIKRKTFAVQLAMSYLLALFLNANCELWGMVLCDDITIRVLGCGIAYMIWFAVWIIYLYCSKQIEELFPISARVYRIRDYLPIIVISGPYLVVMILFSIGIYL